MNPEEFVERLVGVKIYIGGIPFIIRAAREEEASGRIVVVAWEECVKLCCTEKGREALKTAKKKHPEWFR